MNEKNINTVTRLGGYTAIGGAVTMIIGAVLYFSSGTDLWSALTVGDMVGYLVAVAEVKTQLVASLTFWILGVLILNMAGTMLAKMCRQRRAWAQVGMVCFQTGVPLAIVSFIAMLALVVQIAPDTSATAVSTANIVGWIGARADDLATVLIIGGGPLFISLAGRDDWLPTWLLYWGFLAGISGLVSILSLYIPALASFGFFIVPVGMGWMLAAGIVALRRSKVTQHSEQAIDTHHLSDKEAALS
ncbi:MAG: hypothetical protein DHS20C20_26600 [Ardenticatenaceae bacterium]|nr:MAG: hypothetical protein DHS20C20_26600 [Ardenticatenaceae bacterium]